MLLREETIALMFDGSDEDNEGRSQKKGDTLSDGLGMLILKLFRMRLSTDQARKAFEEMTTEMSIGEFQSFSRLLHVAHRLAAL